MDDGAVLLADRWVASRHGRDRAQPTVLVRSPYGRRQFVGLLLGRLLAERGFQVVVQSVRGTFGSGGDFDPFNERADGLATLAWLRAAALARGSGRDDRPQLPGLVQWAIAEPAGDELAAMAIQVSASQFYDETYAGGGRCWRPSPRGWCSSPQERRLAPVAINRGLRRLRKALLDRICRSTSSTCAAHRGEVVWLRNALAAPRPRLRALAGPRLLRHGRRGARARLVRRRLARHPAAVDARGLRGTAGGRALRRSC